MPKRLGGICAAVLCCMLLLFPLAQACGAQGVSVADALNLPDGSATGLSGVLVADVDYGSGLIRVRDPRASFPLLDVLLPAGSSVSVWQTVDVAGVLGTARDGSRVLQARLLLQYTDADGRPVIAPVPAGDGASWPWKMAATESAAAQMAPRTPVARLAEDGGGVPPDPPAGGNPNPPTGPPEGSIAWAKLQPDDTQVTLAGKSVTRRFDPGYCYIQEPVGYAGLRTDYASAGCNDRITLIGTMATIPGGERVLQIDPNGGIPETVAGEALSPVVLGTRDIPGGAGGMGVRCVGTLIRTCGRVTAGTLMDGFFYLDDGAGFDDGTGHTGVRVLMPANASSTPLLHDYVVVTGISGLELAGSQPIPVVRLADLVNEPIQPLCDRVLTVQIVPQSCQGVQEIHATLTAGGTPIQGAVVQFYALHAEFAHAGQEDWALTSVNAATGSDGEAVVLFRKSSQALCEPDNETLTVTATGWPQEPVIQTIPPVIPFSYDIADHLTLEASPWSVHPPQTTCAITAKLATAGGTPLVDVPVTLTTSAGVLTNLTPANGHTDSLGQVHADLTGVPEGGYAVIRAESTDSCQQPIRQTAQVDFLQSTPDDWPMFMHDARHQGYSRYAAPLLGDNTALNLVWSAHVPTHQLESFYNFTLPFLDSSPVQSAGGPVLAGAFQGDETTSTGYLAAFDPNPANPGPDMQPLWRYPAAPQTIGGVCSTPAIFTAGQEKRVVFGSMDGKVYCLAFGMQGCTLCWSYQTRDQSGGAARILSSPAVYAGRVYITNDAARAYCLDAATGECKWMYEFTSDPDMYCWGVSSPAVGEADGETRVYVGGVDNMVYCLSTADNPAQRVVWTYQHSNSVEASPTIYAGRVYAESVDHKVPEGNLACLQAGTGEKVWTHNLEFEVRVTAAAADGAVFVGEDTGHLFSRLSAVSGTSEPANSNTNPFSVFDHMPSPTGGTPYFLGSPALASSGVVYVGNDNWALYALDSETLGLKAMHSTGGCVVSSPALTYAVEQGACWIYVTSRAGGGTLRAYRQGL